MTIKVEMVTFDCRDARAQAQWWARQVGGTVEDGFEDEFVSVLVPDGGLRLGFQRVPDPTPGKNKVHVDVAAADRDAEVERLVADGATHVARHDMAGFSWVVLADPEGNQFCVG